jgi:DNA-binding XRE family transcriptional regulator
MANVNGRIDDLAKLIDLDDQTIIQELKDRYEGNIIYVSIKNKKLNIVTTTILSNEGLGLWL